MLALGASNLTQQKEHQLVLLLFYHLMFINHSQVEE